MANKDNTTAVKCEGIVNQLSLKIDVTHRPSQIARIWHALRHHLNTLPGLLIRVVQQALRDREIRKVKRALGVTAETDRYER
jgi:hypothetical protein